MTLDTELKDLFKKRDQIFHDMSETILNRLPNVLDGCKRFVKKNGGDTKLLKWEDVTYVEDHEVIILIGVLEYSPGDVIHLPDGEVVVINESTAEYFKSALRIAVPYKLASDGTVDDVYSFLIDTMESEDNDHPPPKITKTEQGTPDEFNMDDLTEDQRKAMEMFSGANASKGSKN